MNFVLKSPWMHISISPWSRATGLERSICFKYYILLKWEK